MGTPIGDAFVRVRADTTGFAAEADKGATSGLGGIGKKVGALIGTAAVLEFGKKSFDAYNQAVEASDKLTFSLQKNGNVTAQQKQQIIGLTDAIGKHTVYSHIDAESAAAQLSQYHLTGGEITKLLPLVTDYAARTGQALPAAADKIGKALLGQGRALKSVGIDFVNTKTTAGNYAEIVQGLTEKVKGYADEQGQTAHGQLEIAKHDFEQLEEKAGSYIAHGITGILSGTRDMVTTWQNLSPHNKTLIEEFGGLALGSVALYKGAGLVSTAWTSASGAASSLIAKGQGLIASWTGQKELQDASTVSSAKLTAAKEAEAEANANLAAATQTLAEAEATDATFSSGVTEEHLANATATYTQARAAAEAAAAETALAASEAEASAAAAEEGIAVSSSLGPIGLLVAGVAAGAVAMGVFSGDADKSVLSTSNLVGAYEKAAQGAKTFSDAVDRGSTALKSQANTELDQYLQKNKDAITILNGAGVSYDQYKSAILDGGNALDLVKGKLKSYIETQSTDAVTANDKTRGGFEQNATNAERFSKSLTDTRGALKSAQSQSQQYANFLQASMVESQQKAAAGQVKATTAIRDGRDVYGGYVSAADNAALSNSNVGSTATAAASAYYDYDQALIQTQQAQENLTLSQDAAGLKNINTEQEVYALADAQKTYADSVKKTGANSEQSKKDLLSVQQAYLTLNQDVTQSTQDYEKSAAAAAGYHLTLKAGQENSVRATNDYIYALQQEANSIQGPVHDAIEAHIAALKKIPVSKTTKLSVDTSGADQSISLFVNNTLIGLSQLGVKITAAQLLAPSSYTSPSTHGKRAGGGPVLAGNTYIVGEAGPELFAPDTNGQIFSNQQTKAMAHAAFYGSSSSPSAPSAATLSGNHGGRNGPLIGTLNASAIDVNQLVQLIGRELAFGAAAGRFG